MRPSAEAGFCGARHRNIIIIPPSFRVTLHSSRPGCRGRSARHETWGGERWPHAAMPTHRCRRRPKPWHPAWKSVRAPAVDSNPVSTRSQACADCVNLSAWANTEQATHTARGTPKRLAVRGDFARVVFTKPPHGAVGWPKVDRIAFGNPSFFTFCNFDQVNPVGLTCPKLLAVPRAPVLPGFGNGRKLDYGAPGAANNTGSGALAFSKSDNEMARACNVFHFTLPTGAARVRRVRRIKRRAPAPSG